MSREVRMVPPDWQHPMDKDDFMPLYAGKDYAPARREWDDGFVLWSQGLRDDFKGGKESHTERRDIYGWVAWHGPSPRREDYMPNWPSHTCTHYMMYETTTEGTPLSPAFATPEELARWLADNGASAFGSETASYEAWLSVARGGFAPSAVWSAEKGLRSGVEAVGERK